MPRIPSPPASRATPPRLPRSPASSGSRSSARPGTQHAGDNWIDVDCLGAARDALPVGARPFLALGRQHLAPFAHRPDLMPVVRMIDPPEPPLAFSAEIVLGRPSADAETEAALLRRLAVTHLVCRNSGGAAVICQDRGRAPAGPAGGDDRAARRPRRRRWPARSTRFSRSSASPPRPRPACALGRSTWTWPAS